MSLTELADKMSGAPARILNLEAGEIAAGMPADLTVVDLKEEWTVDPAEFVSKGKNTPFAGRKVFGKVKYTLVDGEIKYEG